MYDLPKYKDADESTVIALMEGFPFAMVIGCDSNGKPVATQLPLLVERDGSIFLSGHMMKGTDHHIAFQNHPDVLCVFTSPHTYVSATWYSNPHQASTWNYMSVHARGKITFVKDDLLEDVLRKTTLRFENGNQESTTFFDNLSDDYKKPLMKAIVAFRIEVSSLEHVFKLSQNRDEASYHNIIHHLQHQDEAGNFIANEMRKRADALFKK